MVMNLTVVWSNGAVVLRVLLTTRHWAGAYLDAKLCMARGAEGFLSSLCLISMGMRLQQEDEILKNKAQVFGAGCISQDAQGYF